MGRFDALTHLDNKQPDPIPSPAPPSLTVNSQQNQPVIIQNEAEKQPAKPQVGKTAKQSPLLASPEKPEKYTTRLEPSLIKKIRFHAIETDVKDYEVVREALTRYFEKRK